MGIHLRVAFITSFPEDPSAPAGGVEAVSVNLVNSLSALEDVDVQVVTTKRDYTVLKSESWNRAVIHRLPWVGGSTLAHAIGAGRRQMRDYLLEVKPDVIHAHDTFGLMVKGMPGPRVFTVHGFIHADTAISGGRCARLRSWLWRWAETAGWADQPHLISISPYVRERLAGVVTGSIHDIDNPVCESLFSVERRERQGVIFSAGAVTPLKNTLGLVDAVARLVAQGHNLQLRLAGPLNDDSYSCRVHERIAKESLRERVVLLGRIGSNEIQRELAAAAVVALVSLQENSPMVIEEAMASGVPVVASNRCGIPYLVRDGESGFLVNPNDSADIARGLGRLLKNDELRLSMGMKGREIARDRFHPAQVARRTRDVYLRAVDDAGKQIIQPHDEYAS